MEPEVRDAATVVLLRDAEVGIETFVMRRTSTMAFAPRMHVFPGGRVDPADFAEVVTFARGDAAELAARGSTDDAGIAALYSCALRETAEEAGIDLSERDADGRLVIDSTRLPIIDHWVTPEVESHRYDVRFFAARVTGDLVRLTTTEADEADWISPARALAEFQAGRMAMLPPTEAVLRTLTGYAHADEAVLALATRPIAPLMPRRIADESGASRWVLVHHRTGEVLVDRVAMPHTRETDGRPMESS